MSSTSILLYNLQSKHRHSIATYGEIDKLEFVIANGTELGETLNESYPTIAALTKVVICVGNSIGIIPEPIKTSIIQEMVSDVFDPLALGLVLFLGCTKPSFRHVNCPGDEGVNEADPCNAILHIERILDC
jgi:hypothetical protein